MRICATVVLATLLVGCQKPNEQKVEIKAAPKLTNDATMYAHQAWQLMEKSEAIVNKQNKDSIDTQVRKPIRELTTNWRINVKMTDSVTEGKYAMCRKALTDLDTWARESNQNNYAIYIADKAQCKDALDHPELGNTSPN